ncbi:MAG TPA: hypothetical protein VFU93_07910, partial [Acidimicrobiales bacterium]|nr:hypothetical protein [Acidimicrobiales bacterium]
MRRALLLALVIVGGCGGLDAQDSDQPLAAHEVPYDLLQGPTTSTTLPPSTTTSTLPWRTNLWYIGGDRLVPAPRQLRDQPEVDQVLRLLLRGPSEEDLSLVRSALDLGDALVDGPPTDGQLTIDLASDFGRRSPSEQV